MTRRSTFQLVSTGLVVGLSARIGEGQHGKREGKKIAKPKFAPE